MCASGWCIRALLATVHEPDRGDVNLGRNQPTNPAPLIVGLDQQDPAAFRYPRQEVALRRLSRTDGMQHVIPLGKLRLPARRVEPPQLSKTIRSHSSPTTSSRELG